MIKNFRGKYRFLSNFYEDPAHPVVFRGSTFRNSEAAFQAAKTTNRADWERFTKMTPATAKKTGLSVGLIPGWNEMRNDVMREVLRCKFADPELREQLLATGDEELVEGNHWGDTYWGVCKGEGQNNLGKALMDIREELRK